MTGEIPAGLGDLANLEWLSLSNNRLDGEIPINLGGLAGLEMLDLSGNALTGRIPRELGDLSKLKGLSLSSNRLTEGIPAELGRLANLGWLDLSDNRLTGDIPTTLGGLAGMNTLELSGNELTGEIPEELGSLAELAELRLSGNKMSGCVPQILRAVEFNDLHDLGLPFCDVLLSDLSVSPGWLFPSFDPYHTDYTVAVGHSRVAVVAVNDPGTYLVFFFENDVGVSDADASLAGIQFDFSADLSSIGITLVSKDGQATHTYTIADLGIRYDADENGVIDRSETTAAFADYFGGRIAKEEALGIVRLNFLSAIQKVFANHPLLPY